MKDKRTEEFIKKLYSIPDEKLSEMADNLVQDLCRSGGSKFTMCVPPRVDDSDMLLCELIRRFNKLTDENKLQSELVDYTKYLMERDMYDGDIIADDVVRIYLNKGME